MFSQQHPLEMKRYNGTLFAAQVHKAEEQSNISLHDLDIHVNSNRPSMYKADAMAQGTRIDLSPNHDDDFNHELIHVLQFKQGRIPTTDRTYGVARNSNPVLEQEANFNSLCFHSLQHTPNISNEDAPIMLKSTHILTTEFTALGVTDLTLLTLVNHYDAIINTDETKREQLQYLQLIMDNLESKPTLANVQQLKALILREVSFVTKQNLTIITKANSPTETLKHKTRYLITGSRLNKLIDEFDSHIHKEDIDQSISRVKYMIKVCKEKNFILRIFGPLKVLKAELTSLNNQKLAAHKYTTITSDAESPYNTLNRGLYWKALETQDASLIGKTAKEKIIKLSKKHLEYIRKTYLTKTRKNLIEYKKLLTEIERWIKANCMLVHYSHDPTLSVLESNDRLRESGMLQSYIDPKKVTTGTVGADKSQNFDKLGISNAGFAFCFLETEEVHGRKSRFGNHRYSLTVRAALPMLSNAWAITYDLLEMFNVDQTDPTKYSYHTVPLLEDSAHTEISRTAKFPDGYSASTLTGHFATDFTSIPKTTADNLFYKLIFLNFQNAENRRVVLENPTSNIIIPDNLCTNFLYGYDIIKGVAARVAMEMLIAKHKLDAAIPSDKDALIRKYITQVVFKMQIMIPHKILPKYLSEIILDSNKPKIDHHHELQFSEESAVKELEIYNEGFEKQAVFITKAKINPLATKYGDEPTFFTCLKHEGISDETIAEFRALPKKDRGNEDISKTISLDTVESFAKFAHLSIIVYIHAQTGAPNIDNSFPVIYDYGNEDKFPIKLVLLLPMIRSDVDNPIGIYMNVI